MIKLPTPDEIDKRNNSAESVTDEDQQRLLKQGWDSEIDPMPAMDPAPRLSIWRKGENR